MYNCIGCLEIRGNVSDVRMNFILYVQSLLAVNVSAVINFLPQLLSQLFHLLTRTSSEDVAMNAVRQVLDILVYYKCFSRSSS